MGDCHLVPDSGGAVKRIHCLGTLVVDALSGPLERYPAPGVRPQVVTDTIHFMPGGGAANTASALARMGFQATVFSKVGKDPNGEFLVRELAQCGVDTSGIRVSDSGTTPFTFVGVHPDGDRTFVHTPGVNLTMSLDDFDLDRLLATDFLFYQDLWVLPGVDGEPGAAVLAEARKRGVVTFLDECWGFGPKRETLEIMVPHCDYALLSLHDLRAVYPGASAEEMADSLLALGAGALILKMGAEGCLVAQREQRVRVAAFPAKVVDTTGAGDCWDAGFIAGLAHGEDIVTAARLGCACAAFCIEAVGGAAGVPDYQAVMRRATEQSASA